MDIFLKITSAINDETRVKILNFIHFNTEVCVCDIENAFNMIQSRISRHLKILKEAGFLKVDRRGRWVYYSVRTPLDRFRQAILDEISYLELERPSLKKEENTKDGAAFILTPILLAKMRLLKLNAKTILAFLLAGGFISDSASLPFVFSNLTNIVTANYFNIGFLEYMQNMFIPYVVSTIISIIVLWLFLRNDIPKKIDISLLSNEDDVLKSKTLFKFSWLFLVLLLASYFIGDYYDLPISIFAFGLMVTPPVLLVVLLSLRFS